MATFDPTQFINKNPVETAVVEYVPLHQFEQFDIDERLKRTISSMGLKSPSPIQDQVIPLILDGKDVVGLAETGTGKTAAFLIPLIERKRSSPQNVTLILTPTRELAIQVDNEFKKLSQNFRMYSTVCVGGTNINPQIRGLRRHNHFIIGTPGRVKDLMSRKCIPLSKIDSVVLDEADRMLDMGFINDMKHILGALTPDRHTLFFSATMDDKTKTLIHEFMKHPTVISVKKKDVTNSIMQDVVPFEHAHKFDKLVELLRRDEFSRIIVFGAMKHSVEKLGQELIKSGIASESIHGNKSHGQRQRSLERFKKGDVKVLVATDVAARGIHVDNVSHVINYDLPNTFEDYVHRIGRTGRGNKRGQALTFIPSGH
jgi:superfamily II DNA/RNA helicase